MLSSALPSLYRPALRLLALALVLAAVPVLHASPITYQMTFTSGSYTGTGTLTLASPPSSSGLTDDTLANQQLQGLTFTVAGQTYSFATDPSASVEFVNGHISSINFGKVFNQASGGYTLEFANGFTLYGSNNLNQPLASGSFSVTPDFVPDNTSSAQYAPSSPTPEPGTLLLLITALLGGGLLIFRRVRASQS